MAKISIDTVKQMRQELLEDSQLNFNFMILTIGACLIATFGLVSNSAAVIIGAMIVAPLMMPLRGAAFGALEGDPQLLGEAIKSIAIATLFSTLVSWSIGRVIALPEFGSEVLARTEPTLLDLGVAVTAGAISGFAKVRPKISDAFAGTAIAVALMPPICVVGLSLSQGIWNYSWGAFLLYLTNLLGIVLACMLVFIGAGYAKYNHAFNWTLGMASILLIPLGISFFQLLRQAQLHHTIKSILLNRTITVGQMVELKHTNVDWSAQPPRVYLTVRSNNQISPNQVHLVENFLSKEMGRPFTLVFQVEQIQEVRAKDSVESPKE
ncbi:DUF389 domain-containing protein [Floridanema aerugineum]|jgi:uncharacterized hydrophobic protein (TIGR00271 family)|uniref:DUF389 domain-containing protein n=1 Tax=Floridaenema aerugineum BLCC-F46 TaxID=3153654 RepID=A0ABV4X841_9CYAN